MTGYAYPPPNSGQSEPGYRASPTGSNQSQQHPPPGQQQHGGLPTTGPPLPPPITTQYYPGHTLPPPQHIHVTSDPNQHLRYPLPPPPDGRVMSGGRHKKEIKRRTKTGCLTCRKRRIKCDEAHPACRNCQKSKRDCLGYDPIFKAQPGPTAIQPAPSASPSMSGTSATAPSYPPPHGYMPAGSQSYPPPPSAGANSPHSSTEPYNNDYSAAIDPALEAGGNGPVHEENASDHDRAKRSKVDELLALRGVSPPALGNISKPISAAILDQIKDIYLRAYAPGLDKFFETRWFQSRGVSHLLSDTHLCEKMAALIQRFNIGTSHPSYFAETAATHSLEATVIWNMMSLPRRVTEHPNAANGQVNYLETHDGVHDAAKRFEIFENLVLGQYLDSKPEPDPETSRNGTVFEEQQKTRERDFWRYIHTFLTLRDDEASSAKEIDDTLAKCRMVLDSRENRDVIYSIVIARHLGARVAEFPNNLQQPTSNEEDSEKNKLFVAKGFIESEAGGKGTNQVIQRVCGMVVRSWTMPR